MNEPDDSAVSNPTTSRISRNQEPLRDKRMKKCKPGCCLRRVNHLSLDKTASHVKRVGLQNGAKFQRRDKYQSHIKGKSLNFLGRASNFLNNIFIIFDEAQPTLYRHKTARDRRTVVHCRSWY